MKLVSKEKYLKAVDKVEKMIDSLNINKKLITLVSGGAALSDHVAVTLYLRGGYGGIELYFPCQWDYKKKKYIDNGKHAWKANPGKTMNYYHGEFNSYTHQKSLLELNQIVKLALKQDNVIIKVSGKMREYMMCKSQYLFALGTDMVPTSQETISVWDQFEKQKEYVCLMD